MTHRAPDKGDFLSVVGFSFYERPVFHHQDGVLIAISLQGFDVIE
jgi:hypothetical protein